MTDDDSTLLRRYTDEKSEEAFAALVHRHLDLVYSVALRQVGGDAHLAQDVAQAVFTALARKAASLAGRPVLGGWLYRTAQFTAIDVVRTESRRRTREQEAQSMDYLNPTPGGAIDWDQLRPTLDRAIGELDEDDRDAVVLRFFEGKSFADVGAKLRLTENTARMRVERALDKLRALLARHGVTSTAAALGAALANQPSIAAPAGLAATVTGAALAGSWVAGVGAAGGGLIAFMSTGKMALGLAGAVTVIGFGVALVAACNAREGAAALAQATSRQASVSSHLANLEKRMQVATQRTKQAETENSRLLAAVEKMKSDGTPASAAEAEPIDSETVNARFKRAQQLAKTGDPAEALRELLWCFDVGMVQVPNLSAVRTSFGTSVLGDLAERFPPAREALLERRERARREMLASEQEFDAAMTFGALNRALNDDGATEAALNQLSPGDRRRGALANAAFDDLVATQRYALALEGRNYGSISSMFERAILDARQTNRQSTIESTALDVEVLAGAGDLAHARSLAERLLAFDGSDRTRALIRQHAERAGHPELMATPDR